VFGFFISGPGIVGAPNMALIPGTTIPVCINSTTNPAVVSVGSLAACTSLGAGSPFAMYYVNNIATGTTITYPGFTTVLTAMHSVLPCSTYHLKLGVADASDAVLDSGVFIAAGSLTSPGVSSVSTVGSGGLPYCVRGCLPGKFVFKRPIPLPIPLVVHYTIAGTAVNGYDYSTIPDSVIIPAYDTMAIEYIFAPYVPPAGPKTVSLLIAGTGCTAVGTVDSATLTIYDSIYTHIITPDTTICQGQSVYISTIGDSILNYSWTPTANLNNPTFMSPTATPLGTTTYTVVSNLAGAGCAPVHNHITITVDTVPVVTVVPPFSTICLGMSDTVNTVVSPVALTTPTKPYTYLWSPTMGISNDTIPNPIITPTVTTTYIVTVNPVAANCGSTGSITITVLPNDFTLNNHDTAICKGQTVVISASGDPAFSYSWSPNTGVAPPNIINPVITPDTSNTYTLHASYPGCPPMSHSFHIDVQPIPVVDAGPDRTMCEWDTIHVHAFVGPLWYGLYSYQWTPAATLDFPTEPDVAYSGLTDTTLMVTVKTPAGCTGVDSMHVVVFPGNFESLVPTTDTGICPRDSVQMQASGTGIIFQWSPGLYLNDTTIANPVSHPVTDVHYHLLVTDIHGCHDTFDFKIVVRPEAILNIADSARIFPGETYQMNPQGNCSYFQWFPPYGLSGTNFSNPVADPTESTRYYVSGSTIWGCIAKDSIDIFVNPETIVDVPNAFVPGSSANSDFKIIIKGIATLKTFSIFNRWGNKVFETNDANQGWNGKYNDEPQPVGVYVYMVEAYTESGKRFYKQGNLTLIR
jgi:gliding motility-associated-like protein